MSHLLDTIRTLSATLPGELFGLSLVKWLPLAIFLFVAALVLLLGKLFSRKPSPLDRRWQSIAPPADEPHSAAVEGPFGALAPALAAQIPESAKERRDFQQLLRGAGLYGPHAATTIYAARFVLLLLPLLAAGIAAVLVDSVYTFSLLMAGGFTAAVFSIAPRLYVFFRRRRRVRRLRQALPDTLDILGMCLGGGMSLSESLDHVCRQLTSYPELVEELKILKRQADVSSLRRALEDFAARVDLPEIRQLTNLISRGDRLGTKLEGSLLGQADHLRTRRKQWAMQQANKAPVKLVFPLMFCFAPAALILLTAPAALELKEFLYPTSGVNVLTADNQGLSTTTLLETLESLDQNIEPLRSY